MVDLGPLHFFGTYQEIKKHHVNIKICQLPEIKFDICHRPGKCIVMLAPTYKIKGARLGNALDILLEKGIVYLW